ncbi:Uncharacterised protein [Vibrio cholerae]|nr:Uncharacterised protein [Vibrio cholerae]
MVKLPDPETLICALFQSELLRIKRRTSPS